MPFFVVTLGVLIDGLTCCCFDAQATRCLQTVTTKRTTTMQRTKQMRRLEPMKMMMRALQTSTATRPRQTVNIETKLRMMTNLSIPSNHIAMSKKLTKAKKEWIRNFKTMNKTEKNTGRRRRCLVQQSMKNHRDHRSPIK